MSMIINKRILLFREIGPSPDGKYEDCWNSTLFIEIGGYTRIRVNGKLHYTHRVAAMIWLDFDLDSELKVLHKCDNRKCFNPEHLWIGTQYENIEDMYTKGRRKRKVLCN